MNQLTIKSLLLLPIEVKKKGIGIKANLIGGDLNFSSGLGTKMSLDKQTIRGVTTEFNSLFLSD